jgi:hypothetical protein
MHDALHDDERARGREGAGALRRGRRGCRERERQRESGERRRRRGRRAVRHRRGRALARGVGLARVEGGELVVFRIRVFLDQVGVERPWR